MISTSGLPSALGLKLIESKRADFEASIEKNRLNAKEIEAFRSRISQITSPKELVEDREVYSFVMKAYDLEDQIFGKAMMRKLLDSDPNDKTSLINKMTKSSFREMFNDLGFGAAKDKNKDGTSVQYQPAKFLDSTWVEEMVDRYVNTKLINSELENNEFVGTALYVQSKAAKVTSWYTVLGDEKLQNFFYNALGMPEGMASTDIDAQVATLKKKFDLSTLNDPGVLEKMTRRYIAISEAKAASANLSSNPILQLFSNNGQQAITSINLEGWSAIKANKY